MQAQPEATRPNHCLNSRGLWPIAAQAISVGLLLALAACGKGGQPAAALAPPEVTVQPVLVQDVPVVYEFVGQTESSRQVEIRARVSGFLEQRLYREGSMVKAGQPLFQLDRKPFDAQLQVARAQLAQEQARMEMADANRKRIEPLAAKNAVSQKDRDDAIGQYRAAAAGVEAAKASVIRAELDLSYTLISSPVGGLSSFAKVSEGTYLDAQNSLLTYVAALSPMRVNFSVSENEALRYDAMVKRGLVRRPSESDFEVEVVLADGSQFDERGHMTFTDASFSAETGTFLARAEFPNAKGLLRPGQFVRVRLHGAKRVAGVLIPQRAVLQTAQGNVTFVVDGNGKAQARPVKVAAMSGDNWLIEKGLKNGEMLVVDGGMKLRPDTPVKIAKKLDAPKPATDPYLVPAPDAGAAASAPTATTAASQ